MVVFLGGVIGSVSQEGKGYLKLPTVATAATCFEAPFLGGLGSKANCPEEFFLSELKFTKEVLQQRCHDNNIYLITYRFDFHIKQSCSLIYQQNLASL